MKKPTILVFCMIIGLGASFGSSAEGINSFDDFWQKFKIAVTSGDKDAVAALSRFPIGMSYGIPNIKSKADLTRRYRDVFNKQTNAAKCFSKKAPEKDADNPKRFSIACPDEGGNEVVVYEFEHTRLGWKFVRLDNLNE